MSVNFAGVNAMASPSSAAIHKLETDGVLLAMDVSHLQKIPESSGGANSTVNCSEEPMAKDQVDKDTGKSSYSQDPCIIQLCRQTLRINVSPNTAN